MTAHGLLLAGILVWLPDGMPDAGPAMAGVEVELLPAEAMRPAAGQSSPVQQVAPAVRQVLAPPVFESLPGTPASPMDGTDKNHLKNRVLDDEAEVASSSVPGETSDTLAARVAASQPPAVQGAVLHDLADVRSETAANVEAEKARNVAVRQRLEHFKHYPASARRRGIEGAVDVSFRLNAEGRAEDMQLVSGSGYGILDDAALNTVRRAEPFPVTQGSYRFRLRFTRS